MATKKRRRTLRPRSPARVRKKTRKTRSHHHPELWGLGMAAVGLVLAAVLWLGFDGGLSTSIAIRTFAIRGRSVTWGAGGGVVADSDPAAEYEETLAKARALVRALSP